MRHPEFFLKSMGIFLEAFSKGIQAMADELEKYDGNPAAAERTAASPATRAIARPKRKANASASADKKSTGRKKSGMDMVFDIIEASDEGVTVDELVDKANFGDKRQAYNAIYRLKKMGKVRSVKKGIYEAV